ncbi:MAG: efflux RND transporter periplasmic adaptor subunit [Betaproteobacteria bacterium]|jgi:membrane fusion protein (multidrug efflux system)|nr:efflux RND transporter periplasmic adaptor subunit [Betaproteobacteria bacterium]
MSFKKPYLAIALVGVAAASGAAWWLQNKPNAPAAETAATAASPTAPNAAGGGAPGGPAKPTAVEVAKVEQTKIVDETQSVGSLRSNQGVVLRPEVGGRVSQVLFKDGQRVKKGQLLVQFDDQLPAAQVMQAKAELSIAQANHTRNQELVSQNFISKRSLDESEAALQVAQAKLALAQATLQRLKIVAPFDGVAGLRQINVGDYLKDGADMVNVEDIDAVLLDFRLAERFQTKVKPGQKAQVTFDALPGRKFTALIQAIDPLIDANGRSVGIRGCIDNRQMQLRPGMFARVNAVFGERAEALVVPEEAIVPQGGRANVVRIVPGANKDELISERVTVKIGLRQPGKVEILEGLALGDTVVVAGQQRLQKDGTLVRIVDTSKGQAGGAAGAAGGTNAGPSGAPAAGNAAPGGAGAKPADAPPTKEADKGKGKMPPVTGENPCLRGQNATR